MMNRLYLVAVSLCLAWTFTSAYYPMVFEKTSESKECVSKVGTYTTAVREPDSKDTLVGFKYNLCVVPKQGQTSGMTDIWGIATDKAARKVDPDRELVITAKTSRTLCERLTGRIQLTLNATVYCDLFLISQDQNNPNVTQLTDIMPLAGIDQCTMKAGTIVLPLFILDEECEISGGRRHAEINFDGYICEWDLCFTEPYQCVPTDGWTPVQMCINDAATVIKCVINFEEGLSTTKGTSSESGGGAGVEVTAEASADFAGLFSASLSTTVSADFSWSDTVSDEATWGETTTHTMEIEVPPGETIQVQQLVGACGGTRVKTRNLRAVQSSNNKKRRIITRGYK